MIERKQKLSRNIAVQQHALTLVNNCAVGSIEVGVSDRRYRFEGLFAAAAFNITIESLFQLNALWVETYSEQNLGHKIYLVHQYFEPKREIFTQSMLQRICSYM